ncbi:MAG: 3-deoxy-7-phosphoheptulonate synthase, partial [Gammaproteobacteria bacterium]
MTEEQVYNVNVLAQDLLPTPEEIKGKLPASGATEVTVLTCRQNIEAILDRRDHRWLMVVGPCSIHDTDAVSEYAGRLQKLAAEVQDTLLIVMRVYFEKPRTAVGWKGFINDPRMDDS